MTILEYHALREVMRELTDEKMKEMEELTEEMEKYCSVDSLEKYLEVNALIHTSIWEVLRNKFLCATLRKVYDQIQRYTYARYSVFLRHGALKRSLKKHRKLLATLASRDISGLKRLVKEHWKV